MSSSIQEGITGKDGFLKSVYQESAKQLGMSESVGSLVYDMIDLGISVKGKLKLVPKLNDFGEPVKKLWHYGRQDLVRAYKQMNNWLLRAEIASDMRSLYLVMRDIKNAVILDKKTQDTSIIISEPENITNIKQVVENCEYVMLITFNEKQKHSGYYRCTHPDGETYKIFNDGSPYDFSDLIRR